MSTDNGGDMRISEIKERLLVLLETKGTGYDPDYDSEALIEAIEVIDAYDYNLNGGVKCD